MTSSAVVNRYANALVDVVVSPASGIDPALAVSQLRSFEDALRTAPEFEHGTYFAPAFHPGSASAR